MDKLDFIKETLLFKPEEMGISLTDWEKIQIKIRNKLFLSNSFFFPGNTPSLKNSKEILKIYTTQSQCCKAPVVRYKTGKVLTSICSACHRPVPLKKSILGPSKTVREYRDQYSGYFLKNKVAFRNELTKYSKPYLLGFYFIRDSRRTFDYGNAKHILLDMMVQNDYFEDDDADTVMDYPLGYHLDPKKPGAYVVIMKNTFLRTLPDYI